MDFKVLVDNSEGQDGRLRSEHGLSFYFEIDGQKWLLDTGASDLFSMNARLLGVDIASVDHLILSHGHADHTGGLETFLRLNDRADIWLSSHIDGRHFYSTRRGSRRDISIDYSLVSRCPERFHFVSEDMLLTPSVALMVSIPNRYDRPMANGTLYADEKPDDFNHEMAVVIRETGPDASPEVMVLSSCSHKGILNTLEGAENLLLSGLFKTGILSRGRVRSAFQAYVGGLHLVESDEQHHFETEEEIVRQMTPLLSDYPNLTVYTGHCTGPTALCTLQSFLKDRLVPFYTGFDSSM